MGEHEDRVVVRRILAPEAGPRIRFPRPWSTSEHVATHHGRADVVEPALDDRRAGVHLTAFLPLHLTEGPEREQPFVELHPTDSEGFSALWLGLQ
jgi:hypothetical protein